MTISFFLHHFNDIDHISPIVWRCANDGDMTEVIVLNPDYDIAGDPRLVFLDRLPGCSVSSIDQVIPIPFSKWIFRHHWTGMLGLTRRAIRKLLRELGVTTRFARSRLQKSGATSVVFEWGGKGASGRREFYEAATELGLRTVCVPHGQSIYVNKGVNARQREMIDKGLKLDGAEFAVYDAFVYQSQFHRDKSVERGMTPDICHVLGSARYCPEWSPVLQGIYPEFSPASDAGGKLKVVMMLPHWDYNVDREATLDALTELARQDWVHLVIKAHTRGTGSLPANVQKDLEQWPDCEVVDDVASVSLISWADVVINFGSSIGIQAVIDKVALVNPHYLHDNVTVFETTGAAVTVDNLDELLAAVRAAYEGTLTEISDEQRTALFDLVVYGEQPPFDILGAYRDLVHEKSDGRRTAPHVGSEP